jgi:hypothetical protein
MLLEYTKVKVNQIAHFYNSCLFGGELEGAHTTTAENYAIGVFKEWMTKNPDKGEPGFTMAVDKALNEVQREYAGTNAIASDRNVPAGIQATKLFEKKMGF